MPADMAKPTRRTHLLAAIPGLALIVPLVVIGAGPLRGGRACGATASGSFGGRRRWIQSPHGSRRGRQSDKAVRTAPCRRCGGRPSRTLMDWIQHDHRYLALGLELIVGVGRPKFEHLFPKSEAFLARRCP